MNAPPSSIEIIDVGVDSSEMAYGVVIGLSLLISMMIFGNKHGLLFLQLIDIVFGAFGLIFSTRIFLCKKYYSSIEINVEKVWLEQYKKPGPAGSIPLYSLLISARNNSDEKINNINVFPFSADNYYESVKKAEKIARDLKKLEKAYASKSQGVFFIMHIGEEQYVNVLACLSVGIFLFFVGYKLSLLTA